MSDATPSYSSTPVAPTVASSSSTQLQSQLQQRIVSKNGETAGQSDWLDETELEKLLGEVVNAEPNESEECSRSDSELKTVAVMQKQIKRQVTSITAGNTPSPLAYLCLPFESIFSEVEKNAKLVVSNGTYKFTSESDYLALFFGKMDDAITGCNEFVESVFYVSLSLMM